MEFGEGEGEDGVFGLDDLALPAHAQPPDRGEHCVRCEELQRNIKTLKTKVVKTHQVVDLVKSKTAEAKRLAHQLAVLKAKLTASERRAASLEEGLQQARASAAHGTLPSTPRNADTPRQAPQLQQLQQILKTRDAQIATLMRDHKQWHRKEEALQSEVEGLRAQLANSERERKQLDAQMRMLRHEYGKHKRRQERDRERGGEADGPRHDDAHAPPPETPQPAENRSKGDKAREEGQHERQEEREGVSEGEGVGEGEGEGEEEEEEDSDSDIEEILAAAEAGVRERARTREIGIEEVIAHVLRVDAERRRIASTALLDTSPLPSLPAHAPAPAPPPPPLPSSPPSLPSPPSSPPNPASPISPLPCRTPSPPKHQPGGKGTGSGKRKRGSDRATARHASANPVPATRPKARRGRGGRGSPCSPPSLQAHVPLSPISPLPSPPSSVVAALRTSPLVLPSRAVPSSPPIPSPPRPHQLSPLSPSLPSLPPALPPTFPLLPPSSVRSAPLASSPPSKPHSHDDEPHSASNDNGQRCLVGPRADQGDGDAERRTCKRAKGLGGAAVGVGAGEVLEPLANDPRCSVHGKRPAAFATWPPRAGNPSQPRQGSDGEAAGEKAVDGAWCLECASRCCGDLAVVEPVGPMRTLCNAMACPSANGEAQCARMLQPSPSPVQHNTHVSTRSDCVCALLADETEGCALDKEGAMAALCCAAIWAIGRTAHPTLSSPQCCSLLVADIAEGSLGGVLGAAVAAMEAISQHTSFPLHHSIRPPAAQHHPREAIHARLAPGCSGLQLPWHLRWVQQCVMRCVCSAHGVRGGGDKDCHRWGVLGGEMARWALGLLAGHVFAKANCPALAKLVWFEVAIAGGLWECDVLSGLAVAWPALFQPLPNAPRPTMTQSVQALASALAHDHQLRRFVPAGQEVNLQILCSVVGAEALAASPSPLDRLCHHARALVLASQGTKCCAVRLPAVLEDASHQFALLCACAVRCAVLWQSVVWQVAWGAVLDLLNTTPDAYVVGCAVAIQQSCLIDEADAHARSCAVQVTHALARVLKVGHNDDEQSSQAQYAALVGLALCWCDQRWPLAHRQAARAAVLAWGDGLGSDTPAQIRSLVARVACDWGGLLGGS